MYSTTHIQLLIKKADKEARDAAQKVYDKYQPELIELIKSEMKDGDELDFAMGTAVFMDDPNREINFCTIVGNVQIWTKSISAGFMPPNIKK